VGSSQSSASILGLLSPFAAIIWESSSPLKRVTLLLSFPYGDFKKSRSLVRLGNIALSRRTYCCTAAGSQQRVHHHSIRFHPQHPRVASWNLSNRNPPCQTRNTSGFRGFARGRIAGVIPCIILFTTHPLLQIYFYSFLPLSLRIPVALPICLFHFFCLLLGSVWHFTSTRNMLQGASLEATVMLMMYIRIQRWTHCRVAYIEAIYV